MEFRTRIRSLVSYLGLVAAIVLVSAASVAAQSVIGGADVIVVDAPQLTSVGMVVAFSIAATFGAKKLLVNVPVAQAVPIWVYVILFSGVFTFLANRVLGTLPGSFGFLLWQAVYNGAAATGIRDWFDAGMTKPLSTSVHENQ